MEVKNVSHDDKFPAKLLTGTRPATPAGVGDAHWNATTGVLSLANAAGNAWVEYTLGSGGSGGTVRVITSQYSTSSVVETASETSLVGSLAGETAFPGDLATGDIIRVTAWGLSYTGATPYDFSLHLYIGAQEVAITNNRTTSPVNTTGWRVEFELIVRAEGAGGEVIAFVVFNNNDLAPGSTPVDFTDDRTIGLTVIMSDGSSGNVIEAQALFVEVLRVG